MHFHQDALWLVEAVECSELRERRVLPVPLAGNPIAYRRDFQAFVGSRESLQEKSPFCRIRGEFCFIIFIALFLQYLCNTLLTCFVNILIFYFSPLAKRIWFSKWNLEGNKVQGKVHYSDLCNAFITAFTSKSTAEVERTFSRLNNSKIKLRNRLAACTLEAIIKSSENFQVTLKSTKDLWIGYCIYMAKQGKNVSEWRCCRW